MGKIKGWNKTKKNNWENEYTRETLVVYPQGGSRIGIARHPTKWYVDIDTGKDLLSVGRSSGYLIQKQALDFAINWMRKHPKG